MYLTMGSTPPNDSFKPVPFRGTAFDVKIEQTSHGPEHTGIQMSTSPGKFRGLAVLYRWRLHAGSEAAFVQAWSRVTDLLLARGSLGSRLHRGSDGLWYGYAQWPSAEIRSKAFALGPVDAAASAQMNQAIAESLPEIVLDLKADYLMPWPGGA